ncbi:tRNA methyltransferase 10 homolog C [Silurus meridionalis]|uniref:tRNA methyltransferase 10 homolog C n=1 Tax=Silurus meridionalis TaxID=175797 RepID=A0A8T0AC21_SILME|nr:tRNA methyltransferase 10 homolog C [Silurus meridionalis]KAF7689674.1 hypothetical protein HF521_013027 [Silurus meridionalis]KAI5090150.1 mitochondrial ribonuclease P protein 1 [Silurus meridionalis]
MLLRVHTVSVMRRFLSPACTLVKYHAPNLFTSCSALTPSRSLSTGSVLRKDAPQQKPELDLDVWKSVMRSQVSQDDKQKEDREAETGGEEAAGGGSPVERSRTLVDMWRQAGKQVPDDVTEEQLETLAELTTKSSKRKYLRYLAIKEGHKKANREKKEKRKTERSVELVKEETGLEDAEEEGEGEPKLKNTFLMQFWTRSADRLLGWRAAQAMLYGQPLVYDMSYDQHMSRREMENTISQLMETEGWNRRSVDSFHLHFCNLQPDGAYQRELLRRYGQEAWDRLFVTATHQRHVDLFPREDLVYLTADSPNVLRTFDHTKVYIIGAMVDRSIQSGASLANAKRLKLSTARLPLDEYLHWEIGAKNLTLDQMIRILMTVKETGSWEKALEFVPKRKHDGFHHHRSKDTVERTEKNNQPSFKEGERNPIFLSKQRQKHTNRSDVASKQTVGLSENLSGQSRLRIALKSKLEEGRKVERKRNWWEED